MIETSERIKTAVHDDGHSDLYQCSELSYHIFHVHDAEKFYYTCQSPKMHMFNKYV
jgi:hypothetical protein